MKKNLLTLGLLSLASGAFAQALPKAASAVVGMRNMTWQVVNQTNVVTTGNYLADQIATVDANTAWVLMSENVTSSESNVFARTSASQANGTEFDFQALSGTGGYQGANISPVNDLVAFAAQFNATGGGEILRTVNGGIRWFKQTTNAQFAAPAGFNNWVHMFNANEGVALGDPNPVGSSFEILRTTNGAAAGTTGATTWARTSGSVPPPLDADEYGLVRSVYALGDIIWAGTSHNINSVPAPVRILKSTDKGVNWTVANTPLTGAVSHIAFKDASNGLAMTASTAGGIELIRTTDGGTTWARVTPVTTNGTPFSFALDAVEGVGFFTSGRDQVGGTVLSRDFGISFSPDGVTWYDLERGVTDKVGGAGTTYRRFYTAIDFIRRGNSTNSVDGYMAGLTSPDAGLAGDSSGAGGFYKAVASTGVLSARQNNSAKVQQALSVYPNPSATGLFQLQLAEGIKAGTQVSVVDILGREVLRRELSGTTVAAKIVNLDLSKEKAGVYTLKLTTSEGTATQKMVIQ